MRNLNNSNYQFAIYKKLPTTTKYMFVSSAHGTLTKADQYGSWNRFIKFKETQAIPISPLTT